MLWNLNFTCNRVIFDAKVHPQNSKCTKGVEVSFVTNVYVLDIL